MSGNGKDAVESPTDFNECVSKAELTKFCDEQRELITTKFDDLMRHINNLVTRVEYVEQHPPAPLDRDADRLQRNRQGMGGNNHGNNDPFSKAKFSMIPFAGSADPEEYLNWELAVEQKFNSHLVPAEHRVRLATSEFTSFALFWWNDLCTAGNAAAVPQTWTVLKQRMKSRFVPPYYQRDLRLKLQTMKQGDRGVEEYYQDLLIGLARCGIREDDEESSARFFGGLNRDIQNILDYKEWTRFSQLYHLALKAEREVQGRRQEQLSFRSTGRSFSQRSEVEKPKAPVAKPPATPPVPAPEVSQVSHVSTVQAQQHKKQPTDKGSTSRSTNIVCHRCKGMGHVMKDCPSTRAFVVAPDGNGYVSASDVEDDDLALATNVVADSEDESDAIDSNAASEGFPSLLVQRALSSQEEREEDKIQRKNLFHMFALVNDHRVLTIIDTGSCNNLVSSDLVKKLGLTTRPLRHSYHLQWLNNSGKAKVTHSARIHFAVGSYRDYADFDVVPMQACSLLLGRPWEFDKDAAHHGRSNTYTLLHKDKNITLLPLSPAEIRKHFRDTAANDKNKPATSEASLDVVNRDGIKLKGRTFLAKNSAEVALCDNHDAPCYTMLSQDVRVIDNPMSCTLHPVVTNIL